MRCMASGSLSKPVSWRPTFHLTPLGVEYTFRRVNSLGIMYTLQSRAPRGDQALQKSKGEMAHPPKPTYLPPREGWKNSESKGVSGRWKTVTLHKRDTKTSIVGPPEVHTWHVPEEHRGT